MNQPHLLDAALRGLAIGLYMAISVGPTLFAVIKYSMDNSYKAGIAFVSGVSLSDILYVTVANVAAGWLAMLSNYSRYIAYGGAAILIAVGFAGLFRKIHMQEASNKVPVITGGHYARIFFSGFIINTINPGVMISWLTAVSTCANKTAWYRFTVFGVCLVLILGIDFTKVLLADKLRTLLTPQRLAVVQRVASGIILALGIFILLHTLMGG